MDIPERLKKRLANPLTGVSMQGKPLSEEEQKKILAEEEALGTAPPVYGLVSLPENEKASFDKLADKRPGLGLNVRITKPIGSEKFGGLFNNLDIILDYSWVSKTPCIIFLYHGPL